MAQDPNAARKKAVTARAKKTGNQKVTRYVEQDLFKKMDQAGPHAGAWLDDIESDFSALTDKPDGLLKSFGEKDFDDLFTALFGYDR